MPLYNRSDRFVTDVTDVTDLFNLGVGCVWKKIKKYPYIKVEIIGNIGNKLY